MNSRTTASSNGTVSLACLWSAPDDEVSGGTDRSLLGVDEFEVHIDQQRDGQPELFVFSP